MQQELSYKSTTIDLAKYLQETKDTLLYFVKDHDGRKPLSSISRQSMNNSYARRKKAKAKHQGCQQLRSKWVSKALHGKYPQRVKQAKVDHDKTHRWLKAAGLKAEIEGFIIAAQDQSLPTQWLYCHNLYQSSHFVIPVAICNKSIALFNFL